VQKLEVLFGTRGGFVLGRAMLGVCFSHFVVLAWNLLTVFCICIGTP